MQSIIETAPPLTEDERGELARCETIIERGRKAFVEVGEALGRVKEAELYRDEFPTFEAYCRARWDFSKPYAYQLIAAAPVAQRLSAIADIPTPTSEGQLRPLTKKGLTPDDQEAIYREAAARRGDGEAPTDAQLKEVIRERGEDAAARSLLDSFGPNRARHEPPDGAQSAPDYVPALDEPVASWKERQQDRFRNREERHREIASKNQALDMGDRRYSVFYGDPAWRYGNNGVNGSAENHYPTMSTDEIAGLPVGFHAEKDAVLLMWATNALLADAFRVIAAWGFEYKTNFVWDKRDGRVGTGWYNHQDHELLLVAVRGEGMTAVKRFSSVIQEPKREHSQKPDVVYEMIEAMYPGAAKLELFARRQFDESWDVWGNQAPDESIA